MKSAEESITWKDGHYEIALTFRDRLVPVPNNRVEAEQHAVRLKRKLQKNPKLLDDYRVFTEDIVEKCLHVRQRNQITKTRHGSSRQNSRGFLLFCKVIKKMT